MRILQKTKSNINKIKYIASIILGKTKIFLKSQFLQKNHKTVPLINYNKIKVKIEKNLIQLLKLKKILMMKFRTKIFN